MNKLIKVTVVMSTFLVMAGCAVGTKIDYTEGYIGFNKFEFVTDSGCLVSVVDQRPYVLSGKKDSNFVGIRRGGYGTPFNVTTTSGLPLANDLTSIFQISYKRVLGASCYEYESTSTKKIVYFLKEWKSDVYVNGWFIYDVVVDVSAGGRTLSDDRTAGKIAIGSDFQLDKAVIQAVNEMHNHPRFLNAMKE